MKITYLTGETVEALPLTRNGENLRAAVDRADDVVAFSRINGTWIADDCEPVQIEFAWERRADTQVVFEEDCCCSRELAARLIHLLYMDTAENENFRGAAGVRAPPRDGREPIEVRPSVSPGVHRKSERVSVKYYKTIFTSLLQSFSGTPLYTVLIIFHRNPQGFVPRVPAN